MGETRSPSQADCCLDFSEDGGEETVDEHTEEEDEGDIEDFMKQLEEPLKLGGEEIRSNSDFTGSVEHCWYWLLLFVSVNVC